MEKIKELFKKWFRKENNETEGSVKVLMRIPNPVIHPFDLMEPIGIAIAFNTEKPVATSSDELLHFALYDKQEKFIGTFFGFEREGHCYGNIIGSDKIIVCDRKSFKFKLTDEIVYPMNKDYALVAKFKSPEIIPIAFRHRDITVHKFDEETTTCQAFDYALAYTE